MVQDAEIHAVDMRQEAVAEIIAASVSDLLFLSELNELGPFLSSGTAESREALAREFIAFARGQRVYDRICVLSPSGTELLRVDYQEGVPILAPEEDLRFKGDGPDFLTMSGEPGGSIYVSPLDVEDDEGSGQPVLRLGLALSPGEGNEAAGYLLLSLQGSAVIDAFTQARPERESIELLLDANGDWLQGPTSDGESEFALPGRVDDRFQDLFPEAWTAIASGESGQLETPLGLFTYDTLIPYSEADAVRLEVTEAPPPSTPATMPASSWKNVSWVPAALMAATRTAGTGHLVGWDALGVLVLGSGAWAFTRWMKRRSDLHRRTASEKELLQSTLGKYIPREICDRLLTDPARHARLGGESEEVAVLFADIRGFTSFAERRAPEEVVAVLNRTMTELTAPLRMYGGILDKYFGDGFLAFFEPAPALSDAARRAVDAARLMQRAFRNLWDDASTEALRELGLGIGISAGRVIVGNVGSEDAMDYTVVGDAVNVASRLQSLAEPGDVLVSESAYEFLDDEDDAEVLRLTRLRGRREPMNVFRLQPAEPDGEHGHITA